MLCAGVVHGDLSEFNVLLAERGPVVIDFPQAIEASKNQNARALLLRDVENLHRFHARYVPNAPKLPYAQEMWALFEQNRLTPDTRLSGRFATAHTRVDTRAVMSLIGDANRDESRRRAARGESPLHHGPRPQGHRPHGQQAQAERPQGARHAAQPAAQPQLPTAAPKARRVEITVERVGRPGTPRARTELRVNHPQVSRGIPTGGQESRTERQHGAQSPRSASHQRGTHTHAQGTQQQRPTSAVRESELRSQPYRANRPQRGAQQEPRSARGMPAPTHPRTTRRPG
jgi:RIO kinase 1